MVKLNAKDKKIFKAVMLKANAVEVLAVSEFIEDSNLSKEDKRFCFSCIGMRCEKLIRNVVRNIKEGNPSFNDYINTWG